VTNRVAAGFIVMTVPDFFEATAMPDSVWWEALWPDPAGVLATVGIAAGMEVIDLCSGDGWFTLPIARVARHVVAIDIDPRLLALAHRRLDEGGIRNCDFVEGNAYDVARPIRTAADFVFLANTFHGVPERPRLARAVRDALIPGGRFAIVNWHPRARDETTVLGKPRGPRTELRMSPAATIEAVEAGGLNSVGVVELPPYHYGALFERSRP
jgi:SAM-dependent methyltransferase